VTAGDAGRARALRLEMLADAPLAFITTLAEAAAAPHREYADRCARLAEGDQQALFVAEADGRLVGQVGAYAHPEAPDRSLLVAIYVTPTRRGDGTLGALIDAVAAWSRQCGRATIELEVVTTNARARRAYRRLGFVPYGAPVRHPTIPVLTEVRMSRPA
jgi:GNAT superfamily N-acetyltransferase